MRIYFSRLSVILAALLALSAVASPVAAQDGDGAEPVPEEVDTVEETTDVISTVDTGNNTATQVVDKSTTGTSGGGGNIASNANGAVYDCYFMANWADASGVRKNDFVSDTSASELQVGVDYWRLCLYGGTNINAGISPADIADDDIATWTVDGWELGPSDFQLSQDAWNKLVAEAIPITLSPDGRQITGLETWIESAAQTTIPQVCSDLDSRVCVRASLLNVTIDLGDGSEPITCTSFNEWTPGATPDCSHTYLVEPLSGEYTMKTTTRWNVQFKGLTGFFVDALPIVIDQDYQVEVIDLEALISG